jgi:hypothetical protein
VWIVHNEHPTGCREWKGRDEFYKRRELAGFWRGLPDFRAVKVIVVFRLAGTSQFDHTRSWPVRSIGVQQERPGIELPILSRREPPVQSFGDKPIESLQAFDIDERVDVFVAWISDRRHCSRLPPLLDQSQRMNFSYFLLQQKLRWGVFLK